MQSYELLNNFYLNKNSSLERTRSHIPDTFTGGPIFNRKQKFYIPNEYDGLTQMNLKVTMTTDADNSNRIFLWQTKVFKSILLRTRGGTVLGQIFPSYTHYRITSSNSELYSQLTDSINPIPAFNATTSTFYLPLFFWFSENAKMALRTRHMEDLELVVETNDDETTMGLTGNVTNITTELRMKFVEPREEVPFTGSLLNFFNIFQEPRIPVLSTETSKKVLLQNPYPSYIMTIHLESQGATKAQYEVNSIKLQTRGVEWLNIDRKEEYKLYNKNFISTSDGSQYIHLFSKDLNRESFPYTDDLILFTGEMYPTYLTCNFNAGTDSYLYITYEYVDRLELKDDGRLSNDIRTGNFQYNKNN